MPALPPGSSRTTKAFLFAGGAAEAIAVYGAAFLPSRWAEMVAAVGAGLLALGGVWHTFFDHGGS